MKQMLVGLVMFSIVALTNCPGWTNPQNKRLGRYELVAHDNSGQIAFTGSISLTTQDGNHLKGHCKIVRDQAAPQGLFDDDGGCEGLIEGINVSFDTAPMMDDAGLLLEGQFGEGQITGIWKIDGFVTSLPLGKFAAVKK